MPDSRPEELIRAEELMENGKLEEAFEIIITFEKKRELPSKPRTLIYYYLL